MKFVTEQLPSTLEVQGLIFSKAGGRWRKKRRKKEGETENVSNPG